MIRLSTICDPFIGAPGQKEAALALQLQARVKDEERDQISECWQELVRGGAEGAGAGGQLTPEELTGGGEGGNGVC